MFSVSKATNPAGTSKNRPIQKIARVVFDRDSDIVLFRDVQMRFHAPHKLADSRLQFGTRQALRTFSTRYNELTFKASGELKFFRQPERSKCILRD